MWRTVFPFQPAGDEFNVDRETGELRGLIEVIDGWWGASLEIGEGGPVAIGKEQLDALQALGYLD